ncbi:neuromedin-U receptor 2-like [Actinia tenebrosa]|uniref:Neuromedin-U receptor 2-like n=1 Tax=Actinia tenebrosa TaxID=6105 RepID=A0A6P8J5Q6_ACTTE|nr:neuromedin-U receptor 2-like [Actinia tenebrosa]
MEAKEQENSSLRTNNSRNVSEIITRAYVFAPVSNNVKLVISTAMLLFGVYGLIANSLILYFKHKQHRRRRCAIQRALTRSALKEYFINSLALSDLLCCLISLPLVTAEMFIDFVHNDWICKVNRFLNFIFPVITILNLLVIGIERYFAIFHPFKVLARHKAKKIVMGAWVLGVLLTLIPMPTYKLIYFEIEENSYTLICKYDNTLPLYRCLFIAFITICYIIPSIILIFVNLRILKFVRRKRCRVAPLQQVKTSKRTPSQTSRFKVTRMFMWLILAFIIPYLLFIVYNGLVMVLRPTISFTSDYLARYASAFFGFSNGAVSAAILFHNEKDLKRRLGDMLCNNCNQSQIYPDFPAESNP